MIFMLCGTSDARELAQSLQRQGLPLQASVVTPSGAERLMAAGIRTRVGRLDRAAMIALLQAGGYRAVVDGSHPFALEAHANAMESAAALGLPYFRYERQSLIYNSHPRLLLVHSYEEAARKAKEPEGLCDADYRRQNAGDFCGGAAGRSGHPADRKAAALSGESGEVSGPWDRAAEYYCASGPF